VYELKVVRERRTGYGAARRIATSRDIYEAFHERFERLDREEFLVIPLDGKNQVLGFHVVSVGTLTASLVHPREVYKLAVLANAAAIVVVHNHPSGHPEPSAEDQAITQRLKEAGELLGIALLDHVVIGDGRYFSFTDQNLL
jgi:DNA repair protein RadC